MMKKTGAPTKTTSILGKDGVKIACPCGHLNDSSMNKQAFAGGKQAKSTVCAKCHKEIR